MSFDSVCRLKKKFYSRSEMVKNSPEFGRPECSTTKDNNSDIKEIIERNARCTVDYIARTVGISLSSVQFNTPRQLPHTLTATTTTT